MTNLSLINNLTAVLKKGYERNKTTITEDEINNQNEECFLDMYYKEFEAPNTKIPTFYKRNEFKDTDLQRKIKIDARTRMIHRGTSRNLERRDFDLLITELKNQATDGFINQEKFCAVKETFSSKFHVFFRPGIFHRMPKDERGRVQVDVFFDFIVRMTNLKHFIYNISLQDSKGQGYLSEFDVESMVAEVMPLVQGQSRINEKFHPFYIISSTRKFMFMLDPRRTGRVSIEEVVVTPTYSELLEVYEEYQDHSNNDRIQYTNWFHFGYSMHVYDKQLLMDADKNGMLNQDELRSYSPGLTKLLIQRVFDVYQTFEGEIDYKLQLDFVLAQENRQTPSGIIQFFKILDLQDKGAIDTFVINAFLKSVVEKINTKRDPNTVQMNLEDLKDEIWDMAKPKVPGGITQQDLLSCGQAGTIIGILIDAQICQNQDQKESYDDPFANDDYNRAF